MNCKEVYNMREEWRDIENYKGLYQVSNMGNVKSLERTVWNSGKGCYKTVHERILKPRKNRCGYPYVNLCKDGNVKTYTIHRLVAQAFMPNPQSLPQVNHIDENKENNHVDNLEWVTCKENINHGTRTAKTCKPIIAIHKITGLILEFQSIHEAERQMGIAHSSISACCRGKLKSVDGYTFFYADADDAE